MKVVVLFHGVMFHVTYLDKMEKCILCALCSAANLFFTICDSPESFENQQHGSNDGVWGEGGREREMTDVSFIHHLVTKVETVW